MVTSVPTNTTITITMPSNETGSGATTSSGGITYYQYYHVGPAEQVGAFGWGIALWGGSVLGSATTTLNAPALGDNAFGTGGSGTSNVNVGKHNRISNIRNKLHYNRWRRNFLYRSFSYKF